ncbi:hypothetical protein [Kozakia baliensis]|uniref:Uncharacterized protein n=1 Tax=Kozakia baliensis TaxID=153496 RepID=A0A1D8UTA9_9PROT|nr:hypothetical protein [Kozakia baliensis]AOX16882.1 hypothetical protein A0U89_06755 [Kozakia baliensis]GBR24578.1 hypothetical protein AA0488_0423 [Kozakia baliensis NRIC 0488]GEL64783.1 hypothetical protein KBA01_20690 [Kozakia baliensis]
MRRQLGFKLTGTVLLAGLGFSSQAHAARVISDYEASKLTLDALTATPVYHRPVVRHVAYRHAATHHDIYAMNRSHGLSRHALVHTVVYHPHTSLAHHYNRRRG